MFARADIREVIHDLVATESGLPPSAVIWADQSGVRPDKPYATLKLISGFTPDTVTSSMISPPVASPSEQFVNVIHGRFTLSANFYSDINADPNAYDTVQMLLASFGVDAVRRALSRAQESTVTVDVVLDNTPYIVTIDGQDITITSDASATDLEIRDALLAAINTLQVGVTAVAGATDAELDLAALPGVIFDLTVGANLIAATDTNPVNLTYLGNSGIQDLTQLLDTEYEERYQTDVFLGSYLRRASLPSTIESVEIDNVIDGSMITVP